MVEHYAIQARGMITTTDDVASRGFLSNALAVSVMVDDLVEADRLLAEAHRLLRSVGDPMWSGVAINRVLCSWWMHTLESKPELMELIEIAVVEGVHRGLTTKSLHAQFAVMEQRYDDALEIIRDADPTAGWEESLLAVLHVHTLRAIGKPAQALALKHLVHPAEGTNEEFELQLQFALAHLDVDEIEGAGHGSAQAADEFVDGFRLESRLGQVVWAWFWG